MHSLNPFFRSILRLLGMSTIPESSLEFPEKMRIEPWPHILRLHYSEVTDSKFFWSEYKLSRLSLYKEGSGFDHEYLVVTAYDPTTKMDRYLRLERYGDRSQAVAPVPSIATNTPTTNTIAQDTIPPRRSGSLQNWKSKLDEPSDDQITVIKNLPRIENGRREMQRLCFESTLEFPHLPTILDLAVVARIVHEVAPKYNLFRSQCYFFADSVMKIFEAAAPMWGDPAAPGWKIQQLALGSGEHHKAPGLTIYNVSGSIVSPEPVVDVKHSLQVFKATRGEILQKVCPVKFQF